MLIMNNRGSNTGGGIQGTHPVGVTKVGYISLAHLKCKQEGLC